MKFESKNIAEDNIRKIGELFPNCITEKRDSKGNLKKAIDYGLLKQILSEELVEDGDEAYEFTWVGKRESILEANKPIRKTLRPCIEESKDWDKTENLYIEGDNLDVLKTLQESYLNSVKMIYIDPPYNTGNDFIYNDDFKMTSEEYREESGELDEDGNRLFKNTDSNGRFHSDWCSMIYSRLILARNLLSDDGAIFISIDDHEVHNLRKICDEVFGEKNFVAEFLWEKKKKPSFLHKNVGKLFEYIICYNKDLSKSKEFSIETTTQGKKYPFNNAGNNKQKLVFKSGSVEFNLKDQIILPQDMSEGNIYTKLLNEVEIVNGKNKNDMILDGEWRYSQETLDEIIENNEQITISKIPFRPNHIKKGGDIKKMKNVFSRDHYNSKTNEDATEELYDLFQSEVFNNPKPVDLLANLIKSITYDSNNAIVLDFFSGSATTAHAVMELNAEDGGNRKFIMVQIEEDLEGKLQNTTGKSKKIIENSINFLDKEKKPCFITEIGKERIRRAGEKIKEENKDKEGIENLDTGFRVLKLDDTNMKDVYYAPEEYEQNLLDRFESNIKEDRDDLDLLFGCLLDWGLPLDRPYESRDIDGIKVHIYNHGDLVACFDEGISESTVKEIAKLEPLRVVFRDGSFTSESNRANVEELFKLLSADTSIRVI